MIKKLKRWLEKYPRLRLVAKWLSRVFRRLVLSLSLARHYRMWRVARARAARGTLTVKMPDLDCLMSFPAHHYFADVYARGSYETAVVRFLRTVAKPGMTCIDIGANVGYYSLLFSKLVGASGKVISFEPTPRTFEFLAANVRLNAMQNVKPESIAMSDRSGRLQFHVGPPGYDVYNSIGQISHPDGQEVVFEAIEVPCGTVDDYARRNAIPRVDIMKIDVEGAELLVLRGMEKLMEAHPDLILLVEITDKTTRGVGYSSKEIWEFLSARKWNVAQLRPDGALLPVDGWETADMMAVVYRGGFDRFAAFIS